MPTSHEDGAGPLTSVGAPTEDSIKTDPAPGADAWTFGVQLCLTGSKPAVLSNVQPTRVVGSGFEFLGAGVRQFVVAASHVPILSADGWPPAPDLDPDPMSSLSGYAVTQPCDYAVTGRYTEMLIGLGRVGTDGGGWDGIEISYTVDGRSFVLVLHHGIAICGTQVSCASPDQGKAGSARNSFGQKPVASPRNLGQPRVSIEVSTVQLCLPVRSTVSK